MGMKSLLSSATDPECTSDSAHRISLHNSKGSVGHIEWAKDDGEVLSLYVGDPYRRLGLGTHLWELATEWAANNDELPPEHSSSRTKEGDGFARVIGGHIPELVDDIDGWVGRLTDEEREEFGR